MTADASLGHLRGRLAVLEARVRAVVAARRHGDPAPDDPFRGLYLAAEQVDRLLAAPPELAPVPPAVRAALDQVEQAADRAQAAGCPLRLRTLAAAFGLSALDVDILLAALAPDLDARFEKLYGYLHDDVGRRRASVGLALELAGRTPLDPAARARFGAAAPLRQGGLLLIAEADRPFLTRSLRVPDRVGGYLLGGTDPDDAIIPVLLPTRPLDCPEGDRLAAALAAGVRVVYCRQPPGGWAAAVAAAALAARGGAVLAVDATLAAGPLAPVLAAAVREARLAGRVLVLGPADAVPAADLRAVTAAGVPVVLFGPAPWNPAWADCGVLALDLHDLARRPGLQAWSEALATAAPDRDGACGGGDPGGASGDDGPGGASGGDGPGGVSRGDGPGGAAGDDGPGGASGADGPGGVSRGDGPGGAAGGVLAALAAFRLAPDQVRRAVDAARSAAAADGAGLTGAHLAAGARLQDGVGLGRLARRIEPSVGWPDLVLPPGPQAALRHLADRMRLRDRVLGDWRLRRGGGRGEGVTALFAGDPGTGKTMAAEVVAAELGLDLYVIDLSSVVDKYIGETEKNLERIFAGAEGVNGVLFFDEADALFGKRSEVSDAHDRYANIEIAYLLQRMERFDGLAVLATNLRSNLDEAFARRLSLVVEFTRPDAAERRRLWRLSLAAVPLAADVDLEFCAQAFDLAGGDIRNVAVTAAYHAAAAATHRAGPDARPGGTRPDGTRPDGTRPDGTHADGAGRGAVDMATLVRAVQVEYRKLGRLCGRSEFGPYYDLLGAPGHR
jgi:hypothetical protein